MFTVVNTRHTIDDLQGLTVWPRYTEELSKLTRKYLEHHFRNIYGCFDEVMVTGFCTKLNTRYPNL